MIQKISYSHLMAELSVLADRKKIPREGGGGVVDED